MVLKKSNCEVNSGNTMRVCYYRHCIRPSHSTNHGIIKYHLVDDTSNMGDNESTEFHDLLSEYVDDGGIVAKHCKPPLSHNSSDVIYSLNKRKRWLIPDEVIRVITLGDDYRIDKSEKEIPIGTMQGLPFRLVLSERSLNPESVLLDGVCLPQADCTAYYDSLGYPENAVVLPKGRRAKFSDLRNNVKTCEDNQKQNASVRNRSHNQHHRGIQRRDQLSRKDYGQDRKISQVPAENESAEEDEKNEIRYEIIHPREETSKSYQKYPKYIFNPDTALWSRYSRLFDKKAKKKIKGLHNKQSKRRQLVEISGLDLEIEKLESHKPRISLDQDVTLNSDEDCYERNKRYDIFLENLIDHAVVSKMERTKRKRKKDRKKERKKDNKMFSPENFGTKESNSAMSHSTKKYAKGSATYLETEKENDFVIVENVSGDDSNLHSTAKTENESFPKNHIKVFTLCKVLEMDLQPEKLVEDFGTRFQMICSHPLQLSLDLGGIHSQNAGMADKCFLQCQVLAEDDLWTDPREKASLSVSVIIDGSLEAESVKKINSILHASLTTELVVYSLREVIAIAQRCVTTHAYQTHLLESSVFRMAAIQMSKRRHVGFPSVHYQPSLKKLTTTHHSIYAPHSPIYIPHPPREQKKTIARSMRRPLKPWLP